MCTREMKDSGIEWIGQIPKDWEVCRLKVLCTIKSGESLSKELIKQSGNFPVFGGGAECLGFHNLSNTNSKDIIIGRVGAKCGCVTLPECDCWATDNALILQSSLHLKFTYFLLCGFDLNRLNVSNAQPLITSSKIKESYVCVPPFVEQIRIATFLDEKCKDIDTLITLQEEMIAELQAYKQSVISETVTKGLNPNVPMKDSGVEWIGEIPEGWEIRKISRIYDNIGSGTTPKSSYDKYYAEDGYNWLQTGDLTDSFVNETSKKITNEAISECSLKEYPMNSIVVAMYGATIGKLGILNISTYTNQACCVMSGGNIHYYKYGFYSLMASRKHIITLAYGGGQPNISQEIIRKTKLPVPPLSEQQAIADYLDTKCSQIDELIALKQQKITELQDYKKSLIYEYVTGKKEVPDNN